MPPLLCVVLALIRALTIYILKNENKTRGDAVSVPGKVFARLFLDKVCHHLLEHQRPEQSDFIPKRSTIDRIPALRVPTEHR